MRCAAIIFEGKVVSVGRRRILPQNVARQARQGLSRQMKKLVVLKLEAKSSSSSLTDPEKTFLECLDTVITAWHLRKMYCNNCCVSQSIHDGFFLPLWLFDFPLHIPANRGGRRTDTCSLVSKHMLPGKIPSLAAAEASKFFSARDLDG